MRYAAFISYSHTPDTRRARLLRQALHTFARPWNRMRALRVFLDNAAMSMEHNLWSTVEQALGDSEYLLLLASPQAGASKWVGKEIDWWRRGPRPEKLLLVVTGGEIHWDEAAGDFDFARSTCLHPALRGHFTAEPRWVDLRWMDADHAGDLRDPRFREAVADLAAPLHGRPKDELFGEDVTQRGRLRRFRRGMLAGMTALAVLATATAVFAFVQRNTAQEQARIATARQLAATALNLSDDDLELASLLAVQAYRVQETPETVSALYRVSAASPRLTRFVRADDRVTALALSNSPRYVAVGSARGSVDVWTADGTRKVRTLDASGEVTGLTFSDDDRLLAVSSESGETLVQDLDAKDAEDGLRRLSGGGDAVQAMMFSFQSHVLATVDDAGTLRFYDTTSDKPVDSVQTDVGSVMNLSFLDEGTKLFVSHPVGWKLYGGDGGKTVELASSDRTIYPFNNYRHAASPNGSCFGFVKYGGVYLDSPGNMLRAETGGSGPEDEDGECPAPPGVIVNEADVLAVSDGGRAAVGTSDGLLVSTAATGDRPEALETLTGIEAPSVLTFSPGDGDRLASANGDTVALWELNDPGPTAHSPGIAVPDATIVPSHPPLAVGPDGTLVWSHDPQDDSTTLESWTPGSKADSLVYGQGADELYDAIVFGRSGQLIYTATEKVVETWSVADSGALVRKHSVRVREDDSDPQRDTTGAVRLVAAADGKVAVMPSDGSVLLLDPATGERSTAVAARKPNLTAAERARYEQVEYQRAFGEQGRLAAVSTQDGRIDIHELPSGHRRHRLTTGSSSVDALALSERNSALYAVVGGTTLQRWDSTTGKLRWRSDGAAGFGVVADPTGRWVATLAGDGTVWLWDARTGERLGSTRLPAPHTIAGISGAGPHSSLAFSPDGSSLWSVTEKGALLSWDTSADAWIKSLCHRVHRRLTEAEQARYLTSVSDGPAACG
ncbi:MULTISPECIES: toll/interleukin-1 receptor domain-containing protein [Streptomyces]|uniref:Toll/interleukin-1 receptor domain-containing protein n=1 Tax=Streptomyces lienomycini TaxID=284035 RepID=A0ABV9X042_9ACTN|nr:PQQ-binding-like beta-propeller repeat protein [Streptomyces lienomycini]